MATFTNQAQLTYSGRTVVSNVVSGEITENLSMVKTALIGEYGADSVLTYVITLTNSGQTPLTGVTLTDDLGEYTFGTGTVVPLDYTVGSVLYISGGEVQPAPTVTSQSPLTVEGITVPALGNAVVIYETKTNAFAPLESAGSITNTVTASSPDLTEDVTASETVTSAQSADLTIVKSLSPGTVAKSASVTYSFVIENTGNTAAPDDVVVTDTFDPALGAISVTFNGVAWTAGTQYTYDAATGLFSTVAGAIDVPAATFSQDPATGEYIVDAGTAVLTVTGTI